MLKFKFRHRWRIGGLIIIVLIASVVPIAFTVWHYESRCQITPTAPRQILTSTQPVEALWSHDGFTINNLMIGTENAVIVSRSFCRRVYALDWHTGDVVWRSELMASPRALLLDNEHQQIYVSPTGALIALSVENGATRWQVTDDAFRRNAHPTTLLEDGRVLVHTLSRNFLVNPENGQLTETSIEYVNHQQTRVQQLVENMLDDQVAYASNLVINHPTAYVLDEQAQLHLIDVETGHDMTIISFTPPSPAQPLSSEREIRRSWVAVKHNIIVIYFQDTGLLTAYRVANLPSEQ